MGHCYLASPGSHWGTRPHALHMVFYLSMKEPESPSDGVEPKYWTLANLMEVMLKAGPQPKGD